MTDDYELINVCDECFRASCLAGKFYCEGYKTAGIATIPKWVARRLGLENEDYINLPEVQVHGVKV